MKHLSIKTYWDLSVTPCVGVWIETQYYCIRVKGDSVTPCVGVWIETVMDKGTVITEKVTPCVGVWIETLIILHLLSLQ